MKDLIACNFLSLAAELADQMFLEEKNVYDTKLQSCQTSLQSSFDQAIKSAYHIFENEQKKGTVSDLKEISISYLHTNRLANIPAFRIDFYDLSSRYSLIECSASWHCPEIFEPLMQIQKKLSEMFAGQSRVGEYELDRIMLELGKKFLYLFKDQISMVLKAYLKTSIFTTAFKKNQVAFWFGEFLDQRQQIYYWVDD